MAHVVSPMNTVIGGFSLLASAWGLDNGVGITPPIGYNTWNDLGCSKVNEASVRDVADNLVSKGLSNVGFEYVNLDDCWMSTERDSSGRLQGDPDKFPSGMAALADYVHSKGLKFGIYTSRGSETCQGKAGSYGNEQLDAQTFAEWGVDFLKEGNCKVQGGDATDEDLAFEQFGLMRDQLNATGHSVFFSVCGVGGFEPWDSVTFFATDPRGGTRLANSWRISSSNVIDWQTCQIAARIDRELVDDGVSGGFNDADMLLGSNEKAVHYLSQARSRTQFNLWAVLMSPLILGTSIKDLNAFDLETYTNEEVIAVSQDSLAIQGRRVMVNEADTKFVSDSVWMRLLADGSVAMLFMNNEGSTKSVTCDTSCWTYIPVKTGTVFDVRDLWTHGTAATSRAVAGASYSVTVDPNGGSKMFRFMPAGSANPSSLV